MSHALIAALLRELLEDPEAIAALREALGPGEPAALQAPVYTVEKLGRTIGMSEKAIRNAITRGKLHARKRSGRWMVTADDVKAWIGPPEQQAQQRRRPRRPRPLGSTFNGIEGWG